MPDTHDTAEALQTSGAQAIVHADLLCSLAAAIWTPAQLETWKELAKQNMGAIAAKGFDVHREIQHIDVVGAKIASMMRAAGKA